MADNRVISPDQLTSVLTGILEDYNADVVVALKKETRKAANNMRNTSKSKASNNGWGGYVGSIATKRLREDATELTMVWYVKAPDYRLTHLLEKGHAIANQYGKYQGKTTAFGFVRASLEEITPAYEMGVRRAISAIR